MCTSSAVRHVCHECGRIFPYGARLKDHYRSRHQTNIYINWHMWVAMICRQGYHFVSLTAVTDWMAIDKPWARVYFQTRDRFLYQWLMEYLLHYLFREEFKWAFDIPAWRNFRNCILYTDLAKWQGAEAATGRINVCQILSRDHCWLLWTAPMP